MRRALCPPDPGPAGRERGGPRAGALRAAVALVALLAGVLTAPVAGQVWKGTSRASGIVLDEAGEPIAGAEVTLRWGRDPEVGPEPTVTDAKGRWALLGLAPGGWSLTVAADGYRRSLGSVEVREGASPPIEVTLRGLTVQTPSASEGRIEALRSWIDTGNSLLERGEWAAARAEYEKVAREVAGPGRAEALRSIARTYYMEGAVDETVATLEACVRAAPGDGDSRKLYLSVMGSLDRSDEGEAFLTEIDAAQEVTPPAETSASGAIGAPAGGIPPAPERRARPKKRVAVVAENGRRGSYTTAFDEHHPLAGIGTYSERFAYPMAKVERSDPAAGRYELSEESFEVYVPKSFDEAGGWGLLVWISPTPAGRVPTSGTRAALGDNRLIWVGANASGNERVTWNRVGLALDAAHNARRYYGLDPERIYVGGYSGGGRIASAMTLLYPEVFRGGLFIYGVDFYRRVAMPDRPGNDWLPWFPPPGKARLEALREEARLVLVTGERDFNRLQTEVLAETYRDEGFRHVTYLEIPSAGHYDWPRPEWLSRALAALDTPED